MRDVRVILTATKIFSERRFEWNANVKVSIEPSACFVTPASEVTTS